MRFVTLTVIFTLVLALCGVAFAEQEVVKTGFGTMKLGGNFQTGFNFYIGKETLDKENYQAVERNSDMEFFVKRVRLVFAGSIIDEKIKYLVQLEGKGQDGVTLADVKLGFKYIPYTTIWVGRFLPHFQYWTPIHTGQLYLVDYPLQYQFFGVQRHTGVDIAFNHKYVDMNLGINNGHNYYQMTQILNPADRQGAGLGNYDPAAPTKQNWSTDENTMKDIYFTVDAKPVEGLDIWAGIWYGSPLDYMEVEDGEKTAHNATITTINGGVGYKSDFGLKAWAEMFYNTLAYDSAMSPNGEQDRADDTYELNSMSYYLRVAYNLKSATGVPVEFLVQYDWLDPDTLNDANKGGHEASEQDELTYVTAGVNYYIKDWHAMLYLNYIYKMEAWEDVANKAGTDTQDGISNDELKVMAQIAF